MKNKNFLVGLGMAAGILMSGTSVWAQEIIVKDNVKEPTPVDFPGRVSLGEPKEAPLPSLSDGVIKDPAPMERVVSKKELPSEQLLGRITSEVFHEMADLERGNVFLKLQAQREQLKNDLEKLKATYREARLAEIEKRENVIRTRVKWQQEQEQIRQEILEQQLKTELLEKQLEESEIAKEDLLPLTQETAKDQPAEEQASETPAGEEQAAETTEEVKEETPKAPVFKIQKIVDIKGMKNKLSARVIDNNGKMITLKVGSTLPSGQVVKEITKTDIILTKDDAVDILNIEDLAIIAAQTAEETKESTPVEETTVE